MNTSPKGCLTRADYTALGKSGWYREYPYVLPDDRVNCKECGSGTVMPDGFVMLDKSTVTQNGSYAANFCPHYMELLCIHGSRFVETDRFEAVAINP